MENFYAKIELDGFTLEMAGSGDTVAAAAKLNDVFRGGNVTISVDEGLSEDDERA